MSGYLNALKTNGVNTLKNFVIDTALFSVANWVGDRYVASIVGISSPFAGASTSLVVNGVDLLGKVISTRYSNNDYLGSALRVALTSASLVGSKALAPNLAGRVGIEISREVMLRYTVTATLVLLIKNIVPVIIDKFRFSESNVNYEKLSVAEVNDPKKYSDDQIVRMSKFVRQNENVKISQEARKAIFDRAQSIENKPENINYKELTVASLVNFSDEEILAIHAFFLSNSPLSNEKLNNLNKDISRAIAVRANAIKRKPENINYKELTITSLVGFSDEEILAIDRFFISRSPLSQVKRKDLQADLSKIISDRAIAIKGKIEEKRKPEDIDYSTLTVQDVDQFNDEMILAIDTFFSSETPLSQAKIKDLKNEVLQAISAKAEAIKNKAKAKWKPEDIDYKTLTVASLADFNDTQILAIDAYLKSNRGIVVDLLVKTKFNGMVREAKKKPENVDYKALTVADIAKIDTLAIDAFLSSGTPLSQEKLKDLQAGVLQAIKDDVAAIKRQPDKINYKELKVEDLDSFSDSEILFVHKYFERNNRIINEKRADLKAEVAQAIKDRVGVIKKDEALKRRPENLNYKALTVSELNGFSNDEILAIDTFLLSNDDKKKELQPSVLKELTTKKADIEFRASLKKQMNPAEGLPTPVLMTE